MQTLTTAAPRPAAAPRPSGHLATAPTTTARLATDHLDTRSIDRIGSFVGRLGGVDAVTVCLTDPHVDIGFDPDEITVEELREVVSGLGYRVTGARVHT